MKEIENKLKKLGYEEFRYYDNPKHMFISKNDLSVTIRIYKNEWQINTFNHQFYLTNKEIDLIKKIQIVYWELKK